MHVGVKARHDAELRAEAESPHEHYDYRSVRSGRARACARSCPASATPAAIYDSNSGHLQPYKFTLGLAGRRDARRRENLENSLGDEARSPATG
jgi:gamma-glutamylputrescine oxidase